MSGKKAFATTGANPSLRAPGPPAGLRVGGPRAPAPPKQLELLTDFTTVTKKEETIVGKLTEVYQTVHLKEFTDFPKKDEKDPTEVFTDIHFEKKSVAHEAYHLSHGFYH